MTSSLNSSSIPLSARRLFNFKCVSPFLAIILIILPSLFLVESFLAKSLFAYFVILTKTLSPLFAPNISFLGINISDGNVLSSGTTNA